MRMSEHKFLHLSLHVPLHVSVHMSVGGTRMFPQERNWQHTERVQQRAIQHMPIHMPAHIFTYMPTHMSIHISTQELVWPLRSIGYSDEQVSAVLGEMAGSAISLEQFKGLVNQGLEESQPRTSARAPT